jgi:hypothetical protein
VALYSNDGKRDPFCLNYFGQGSQAFDLNVEKVLEHWSVAFAIRELIANALDEQALTGTRDPGIFKDRGGYWHIADAGRGIRYEHLTQNENAEKRYRPASGQPKGVGGGIQRAQGMERRQGRARADSDALPRRERRAAWLASIKRI